MLVGLDKLSKAAAINKEFKDPKGQTAFIPAKLDSFKLHLEKGAKIALILAEGSELKIK